MLHSEHMFELGGAIEGKEADDGTWSVDNKTPLTLQGAVLVQHIKRDVDGQGRNNRVQWASIGTLSPGQRIEGIRLAAPASISPAEMLAQHAGQTPHPAAVAEPGELSIRKMVEMALDAPNCESGEVRLVAWSDDPIRGLKIFPAASNARHTSLVVVHLQYARLADPVADTYTPQYVNYLKRRVLSSGNPDADEPAPGEDAPQEDDLKEQAPPQGTVPESE
jgi:hypothetical protein